MYDIIPVPKDTLLVVKCYYVKLPVLDMYCFSDLVCVFQRPTEVRLVTIQSPPTILHVTGEWLQIVNIC